MKHYRYILLIFTLFIILLSVPPVFAKKKPPPPPPVVTVVSRWTPQEQLVSVSGDTRTVNLQMSARSDRQFWAMDISCLVSQAGVFEASPIMTPGAGWLTGSGTTYSDVTPSYYAYDSVYGQYRINATMTRVGASNSPMGVNGTTYTEMLFDLELTLSEGLVGTNTISLTCDTLTFLDRNGASLGDTVHSNSNNLTVRDGYVLSGVAERQGNADKSDILVSCENVDTSNVYTVVTATNIDPNLSGQFSFSNQYGTTDPLRDMGLYECTFTSKFGGTVDTVYLKGTSFINLQTSQYTLQPIMLRAGDTNADDDIDTGDFIAITTHWQNPVTALQSGDVNGDATANETDLAITAGNVGLSPVSGSVWMDHVIYSVARDYNGTFPNNTLVMGDVFSGDVTTLNTDRILWPQVSPDGSQVAYYSQSSYLVDKKGRVTTVAKKAVQTIIEEGIFVGDTSSFSGSLVAGGKNFAPSWSPSGGKIAFVCSWDGIQNGIEGYYYNNGNICVMNASGGTARTIIPPGASSTYAEVFPPAWYNETTLVYAGNTDNDICPDQLCYYDLLTNTHGKLTVYGVDGNSVYADMPVIIRYSDSLSYLFYRFFDSGSSELRMGTIEYDGSWSQGVVENPINFDITHKQVEDSDNVHYYDVSPMLDVMFYGFGDYQFHNLFLDDLGAMSWVQGDDHSVDGFIGYPMITEYDNIWDGFDELTAGTDFHAYRATFDWIP